MKQEYAKSRNDLIKPGLSLLFLDEVEMREERQKVLNAAAAIPAIRV